ncbi:ankyrin repeat domain-containing protein [Brevibacillus halotolerans]|uniref:ankyrin repeat domain-containing protein n=1 Tax=Brevibacillus TaxID=55080 RepID=UPI00215BB239|nr:MULTISPECIES: ankyrin repeat domain-containing protein [Brevibacillus]MCR8964112.1 ankyrin repeat domain-containing protein [Brevibacillus laterosporus]MCZ0836267.1 ankyrin repeat domain-containing protein [Brevibacillus halotolerans]
MTKKMIIFSFIVVMFLTLFSYRFIGKILGEEEHKITNINIYKETPAWNLALAVRDQNIKVIEKIAKKEPYLLNYQDPKYGATLLFWAVGMEKYESAEALLKCGANPNIQAINYYGETPLFRASGYSFIDNDAKKDPKYVKLLLKYGGDPNINYIGSDSTVIEPGTSPLMKSIGNSIEKTKALVEAGADINYKTKRGKTAAIESLIANAPEYARYLIVEKKAKVSDPYFRRENLGDEDPNEKLFPVRILRSWVFDLGSAEHKMKMEIVEEFARQGVNYWDTQIDQYTLDYIQKRYPDTWKEYTKKY